MLRDISTRCRWESATRNRDRKSLSSLCNIENLYALATSGYLTVEDSTGLVQEALQEVEEVRKSIRRGDLHNGSVERLDTAEEQLNNFSGEAKLQRFGNMTPSEVVVYQRVFGAVVTFAPSPGSAREFIESVFAEASKVSQNGSGKEPDQRTGNYSQAQLALDDTGHLIPS